MEVRSTWNLEQDPITSVAFYRVVLQAVLLFWGGDMILFSSHVEADSGVHTGFLRQVMGKWARRQWGGTWQQEWA